MTCTQPIRKTLITLALVIGGMYLPNAALAQQCAGKTKANFSLGLDVAGTCGREKFATAEDFFDGLQTDTLHEVRSDYSGSEIATLNIRFNSLPINLEFPNVGNTGSGALLNFSIPRLGIHQVFQGNDRDDSIDQLEHYVKHSGIINDILKYQIAHTANNPLTGPGGLLPTTVANDFGLGFDTLPDTVTDGPVGNQFGASLNFASAKLDGRRSTSATLPFSYTIRNDIDPRRQLVFSLPVTVIETDGAKSYTGSLGVAYRLPITRAWTLTPAIRYGFSGSADLATAAALSGGSVSSNYVLRLNGFDLAIGNMVGYYQTTKFKAGDYSVNPHVRSTVLRNGLMVSQPVTVGGRAMSLEYSLIDTRYLGTKIYVDNTQEIGVSLGTNRSIASAHSHLRAGMKYQHGRDVKSLMLNVGYWF
ncbi:MAG: hypothetical protein LBS89_02205 [Zoogloeaceae bacterium]|jgi:hypothetical protein|nr:hypothetical protein [Zoogloeaceae bacterium]